MESIADKQKCTICGVEKTYADFHKHPFNSNGIDHRCKSCLNELRRERRKSRIDGVIPFVVKQNKICTSCGLNKNISEFGRSRVERDGHTQRCKKCRYGAARPTSIKECVYLIQSGDNGPIKIGFTRNLKSRLLNIQTGHPYKLKVLLTLDANIETEHDLHVKFSRYRITNEWYEPVAELTEYIGSEKRKQS